MRLAAIDIGTNSVHMIVVRVRPDFSFEVIDREKEMVRLGAGGLDGKKLTHEAMTSALQALSADRPARREQAITRVQFEGGVVSAANSRKYCSMRSR